MLEYVRRLLLAQVRLAAQFDTAPQPEIREVTLRSEQEAGDAQEQSTQSREKRPGLMQAGAEMDGTETWSAEQALREMARQTLRLESMQLQKSAQAQMEQTRRLEAAMTELTQRQRVDITARTPDSAAGGMMGSLMADLETNLESINKYKAKRNLPFMTQDELLIKLFNEVAYVWPRVGYPPLVTPFSQYVKNLAMMNVMAMEKGKERWGMIADDIWDMILGRAGRLPGKLAPEIIEKAEREGRKFFDGNPQDNYPDQLDKYRKMMLEKQWDKGQDDEELFEYAMHPAQYEAYKSGKAKEDFLADVKKRREEKANATAPVEAENKTKVLTVDVNGQPYRVTVAYGAVDPATLNAAAGGTPAAQTVAPVGEGKDILSPLEGKFFLVKNAQETPKKVGDKVAKGEVICYVEAMKTYNAIRAEYDGTITAICVNSGDSVSEDDVLMKIL